MNAGRPRKPTALKVIEGTLRKDRTNPRAPVPAPQAKFPNPPKDLSDHEAAAWRTLSAVVKPLGVATVADMIAFRQMAVSLAMIDKAREALAAAGGELTYEVHTEHGTVFRKMVEVEIIATFKKLLALEISRFGLTPADRERVSALSEPEKNDPLDEFAISGG